MGQTPELAASHRKVEAAPCSEKQRKTGGKVARFQLWAADMVSF